MHILLVYEGGRTEDALMLGATEHRMRVMLRGLVDVVEFREFEGKWFNESGAAAEIGALTAIPYTEEEVAPRLGARLGSFLGTARFGRCLAN